MQKAIEVAVSILGALIVILLLVLRPDHKRNASQGPAWWRKLVAGGLTLLGLLGVQGSPARAENWIRNPNLEGTKNSGQEASPEISELARIWDDADAAASGKKGDYPFDSAGKQKLLADLESAGSVVDSLVGRGTLSTDEGKLLKADFESLAKGVQRKRPTEMKGATCYKPMMFTPAGDSLGRLEERLPSLEKLSSGKVSPIVFEKVLSRMEQDLATLATRKSGGEDREIDEKKASETEKRVREAITRLRESSIGGARSQWSSSPDVSADSPETEPEFAGGWKEVIEAFAAQDAILTRPSTEKERQDEDKETNEARKALEMLVSKKLLSSGESDLVENELKFNSEVIRIDPPSDSNVECYKRMMITPLQRSLERLDQRLPVLQKVLEGKRVNRLVGDRVLAALESDLKILVEARGSAKGEESELKRAVGLEKTVAAMIDELKSVLGQSR